jgi:hypothetical protein
VRANKPADKEAEAKILRLLTDNKHDTDIHGAATLLSRSLPFVSPFGLHCRAVFPERARAPVMSLAVGFRRSAPLAFSLGDRSVAPRVPGMGMNKSGTTHKQ